MIDNQLATHEIRFEIVNELPKQGIRGIIYVCNDMEYIFIGNKWDEIGKVELYHTNAKTLELQLQKEKPPTNCKNCGAVLNSNVCEYCGSIY